MRLIDADALLNRMQEDPLFDLVERYGVSGVINAEPTVDAVSIIRCNDCKYWCKGDMLPPIEGISYHSCWVLIGIGVKGSAALVPSYHYCGWAERKDVYVTLHHDDIHFKDEESEKAFYNALAERKEE